LVTLRPGTPSQALQLSLKFAVAKVKVFSHLEAWLRVEHRIPHVKGYKSKLRFCYSKKLKTYKNKTQKNTKKRIDYKTFDGSTVEF
jgi:hypothetical protein